MRHNLFYLPRTERIALCIVAVLLVAFGWWAAEREEEKATDEALTQQEQSEVEAFLESTSPATASDSAAQGELFAFDPNRADSATLRRLGLRAWQVRNLLKYRERGGTFRTPDDLSRLYGLTAAEFERLKPYVRIAPTAVHRPARHAEAQRPAPSRPAKLSAGERIDLSRADSAQLCRIPGIGPYRARAIVRYGERLGGYVSTRQLLEIEGMPDSIGRWVCLSDTAVRKLSLNRADFRTLLRHPYLSYEQVKVIVHHRERYGPLKNLRQLSLYPEFTAEHLKRLQPYAGF